jgi:hypothetical protein
MCEETRGRCVECAMENAEARALLLEIYPLLGVAWPPNFATYDPGTLGGFAGPAKGSTSYSHGRPLVVS